MKKALINVHPFQTSTFPLQQAAAYQWQSESVPALLNHIATDKASCSNFQGLFYKNLASDNKERKARVLDPSPRDLNLFGSLEDLLMKCCRIFPKVTFHLEFHTEVLITYIQHLANQKKSWWRSRSYFVPSNFQKLAVVQQNYRS